MIKYCHVCITSNSILSEVGRLHPTVWEQWSLVQCSGGMTFTLTSMTSFFQTATTAKGNIVKCHYFMSRLMDEEMNTISQNEIYTIFN